MQGGLAMTDMEKIIVETEARTKNNEAKISDIAEELREVKGDQKAIYEIASSIKLIAQRVEQIDDKVNDTNDKVNKLAEKVNQHEILPYKKVADNWNSIKVSLITSVLSLLGTGIIGTVVIFGR